MTGSVPEPTSPELPFSTRFWFAWVCFFRILFDGSFAARAFAVREPPQLPPAPPKEEEKPKPKIEIARPKREPAHTARETPLAKAVEEIRAEESAKTSAALQVLALLQREGRLVDFLEEDVATFSDAEIGAAARVVHEGCRKALRTHVKLKPIREGEEGVKVTLEAGFRAQEIKLSGDVKGSAPYHGVLKHRGWRAEEFNLPLAVAGHDPHVIAPAEVEL